MAKYQVMITVEFDGEKHCNRCTLRSRSSDDCTLQECDDSWDWDDQMKNCPLTKIKQ